MQQLDNAQRAVAMMRLSLQLAVGMADMSDSRSLHSEGAPCTRRHWEAPALTVLMFRHTAGTQQAGADNPQVASYTPGTGKLSVGPDGTYPGGS